MAMVEQHAVGRLIYCLKVDSDNSRLLRDPAPRIETIKWRDRGRLLMPIIAYVRARKNFEYCSSRCRELQFETWSQAQKAITMCEKWMRWSIAI
jgi:hypothetical protein